MMRVLYRCLDKDGKQTIVSTLDEAREYHKYECFTEELSERESWQITLAMVGEREKAELKALAEERKKAEEKRKKEEEERKKAEEKATA